LPAGTLFGLNFSASRSLVSRSSAFSSARGGQAFRERSIGQRQARRRILINFRQTCVRKRNMRQIVRREG
jgi:hypothetical protein